jgi:hypothetical protein
MSYKYFVSFNIVSAGRVLPGNYEIIMETPIETRKDIDLIEKKIEEDMGVRLVVINNWKRL